MASSNEIDVRQIPRAMRHELIFSRFDALSDGEELSLLVDHEPRPLRQRLMELHSREFMWVQQFCGNDLWRVTIRRIAALSQSDDVSAFLARCPLTGDIEPALRHTLAHSASEIAVERNAAIVEQGQEWPYLGFVRQGVVSAILTSPYGREQTLYEILATESFNEMALLDAGSSVARFVASTSNVRVLIIPLSAVEAALGDMRMLRQVAAVSAQRQRLVIERFAAHISLPIVARVAATLLPYAPPSSGLAPVMSPLDSLTQVQLAVAAGTVKEVLSRALLELEAAGALRRQGGRITELNRDVLQTYAQAQ